MIYTWQGGCRVSHPAIVTIYNLYIIAKIEVKKIVLELVNKLIVENVEMLSRIFSKFDAQRHLLNDNNLIDFLATVFHLILRC